MPIQEFLDRYPGTFLQGCCKCARRIGPGGGARGYQRLRLRPFDANAVQLHQDVSALRVPGCHRVASGPVARRSRTRRASCTGARRDLDLPGVPPRAALEQLVHVQPAVEVFAECDAEPADAWDAPGRVEAAAALRKVIVLAAVAAQGQKRHGLAARKTGAPVRPPAGRHVSPLPECARPSALATPEAVFLCRQAAPTFLRTRFSHEL